MVVEQLTSRIRSRSLYVWRANETSTRMSGPVYVPVPDRWMIMHHERAHHRMFICISIYIAGVHPWEGTRTGAGLQAIAVRSSLRESKFGLHPSHAWLIR